MPRISVCQLDSDVPQHQILAEVAVVGRAIAAAFVRAAR